MKVHTLFRKHNKKCTTLNSTSETIIGHTGQVGANQPTEIVVSNNLGCLCTMINLLLPYLQHICLLACLVHWFLLLARFFPWCLFLHEQVLHVACNTNCSFILLSTKLSRHAYSIFQYYRNNPSPTQKKGWQEGRT